MPVRDGAKWLGQALDSILGQTFENFEVRVLDDASTDTTREILAGYVARDPRVVAIHRDTSNGIGPALRALCDGSRGVFIARMDADDIARPDRLATQVALLEHDPELAVVGGAYRVIESDGRAGRTVRFPESDAAIRRALVKYNCIAHGAATFRRDAYEAVGGFRLDRLCEDYDLWLRVAERYSIANVAEPVIDRREHGGQLSQDLLENQVAAMLVVVESAERRRAGAPDPLDGNPDPDWNALYAELGIAPERLRAALIDAYASRAVAVDERSLVERAQGRLSEAELRELSAAIALRRLAKDKSLTAALSAGLAVLRSPRASIRHAARRR
jgi:glycosyltransferase involved in cell wall biosynthesis